MSVLDRLTAEEGALLQRASPASFENCSRCGRPYDEHTADRHQHTFRTQPFKYGGRGPEPWVWLRLGLGHDDRDGRAALSVVVARVLSVNDRDCSEMIAVAGHEIQFGGGNGDGYCYAHQSFSCVDHLTEEERAAIRVAEVS